MVSNDSSMIKPVEGLQNIASLTPAGKRERRKRRQNLSEQDKERAEHELKKSPVQQSLQDKIAGNEGGQNTIDYCA